MADATVSRLGQANATGDAKALFLKVFGGEVLAAFHRNTAFRSRHMVRTIPHGKSATFPNTGLATAVVHTPGAEITGGIIRGNERVIVIDDMIIAPTFIANIDEAMNHYDVRSIYSGEIGEALAKLYDQNVSRAGIVAARTATNITGLPGGATANDADFDTDGTKLWTGIFNAGVTLDTKDVPNEGRSGFVRPVQYALIVMSEKPIDINLNANGNNGSIAVGDIKRINSIELVKTNNLVSTNDSANALVGAANRADFTPTMALVQHKSAVGTVQLQDVSLQSEYDIRRQGTLMVGRYLVGHGVLRPEAGVELRVADPA